MIVESFLVGIFIFLFRPFIKEDEKLCAICISSSIVVGIIIEFVSAIWVATVAFTSIVIGFILLFGILRFGKSDHYEDLLSCYLSSAVALYLVLSVATISTPLAWCSIVIVSLLFRESCPQKIYS